jgi:hypothetical protein
MSDQPQSWQSYEQVAVEIMNKIAALLGLEAWRASSLSMAHAQVPTGRSTARV